MDFLLVEINSRIISGHILNPTSNRLELIYSKRLKSNKNIKKIFSNNELFDYVQELLNLISIVKVDKKNISLRVYGLDNVPIMLLHNIQDVLWSHYKIKIDISALTLHKQKIIYQPYIKNEELIIRFRYDIFYLTYRGSVYSHQAFQYMNWKESINSELLYFLPRNVACVSYLFDSDLYMDIVTTISEYVKLSIPNTASHRLHLTFDDMYWNYIYSRNQVNKSESS